MPFELVWKPVLRQLELKEYHPDFAGETIAVCVNPSPEMTKRLNDLMEENAKRFVSASDARGRTKKQQGDDMRQKVNEYIEWRNQNYLPALDQWHAEMWSFGGEFYTAETIQKYRDVDPDFVMWLFAQTDEMIMAHRTGKKKN